jgi:hypothetical protein
MIYGFQQEQVCLWGVVSGFVRIFVTMNEQDPKLAHCAGPGFWFGEIPVITGWTRAVQVMAFGDLRLCAIDRSVVTGIARRNPEVWRVVATLSVMNGMTAIGGGRGPDDPGLDEAGRRGPPAACRAPKRVPGGSCASRPCP